ncbi:MAG: OsmC family protein [Treponemataceae bacterium]
MKEVKKPKSGTKFSTALKNQKPIKQEKLLLLRLCASYWIGGYLYIELAKEIGGNDKGGCPASLLSAAICGCETMIASVLIEKMRLKVKSFNVEVTGLLSDDYAKNGSGFHDIHTTFSFDSDEPDEKLQKLVEMVEASCPVMNSIKKPGKFHSEIKKI